MDVLGRTLFCQNSIGLQQAHFNNFTLTYDAENRLVSVTGAATANFYYDGDGKQVTATVNGVTTYYVGNHYEVKNSVVAKYYFAGATRIAVRTNGTLSYLLGDHIGSSSVTTDASGVKAAHSKLKMLYNWRRGHHERK
jgi:YD repeat-containing protein